MKKKISTVATIVIILILIVAFFYRLPYYVESPGSAERLDNVVHVKNGDKDQGDLMLTTVRLGRANVYDYFYAKWKKYVDLEKPNNIKPKEQTDEEYNVYQLYLMEASKNNAIEVAYKKANKPFQSTYTGVYILSLYDGMPASKVLKVGDRIIKVNGKSFQSSKEFMNTVKNKKAGDSVQITYVRNNQEKTVSVPLAKFPKKESTNKVGIGIGLVDDRKISSTPAVTIDTEKIGGPSAGLMFSLEIYNQLTSGDITKGREIAGTGEIAPDGTVGRIGGIDKKVVAADKEGATIFLAPNDDVSIYKRSDPKIKSNYEEAKETAKAIGSKMKVVPVKNFDEALSYLKNH